MPALFRAFENTSEPWLGTFWWGRLSGDIPDSYREAAHRLFRSRQGDGADAERILLPILYTYRHAIETLIKQAIMASVILRSEGQDATAPDPATVEVRLRRDLRHKLADLRDFLNEHLQALQFDPVGSQTSAFLDLLADLDPNGNAFRFAQQLPDVRVSLDLPRLMAAFDAAYSHLLGIREYLIVQVDDQRDWTNFLADDFE
ncbi:hypothetical protein [Leifsonia xyli]|uniref:hypothetical protein n=1 Tax=Leifsonia xyli TaxID=1575 RepID=UPI003D6652A4